MLCTRKKGRGPPEPGRLQHHRHIMPRGACLESMLRSAVVVHHLPAEHTPVGRTQSRKSSMLRKPARCAPRSAMARSPLLAQRYWFFLCLSAAAGGAAGGQQALAVSAVVCVHGRSEPRGENRPVNVRAVNDGTKITVTYNKSEVKLISRDFEEKIKLDLTVQIGF